MQVPVSKYPSFAVRYNSLERGFLTIVYVYRIMEAVLGITFDPPRRNLSKWIMILHPIGFHVDHWIQTSSKFVSYMCIYVFLG